MNIFYPIISADQALIYIQNLVSGLTNESINAHVQISLNIRDMLENSRQDATIQDMILSIPIPGTDMVSKEIFPWSPQNIMLSMILFQTIYFRLQRLYYNHIYRCEQRALMC